MRVSQLPSNNKKNEINKQYGHYNSLIEQDRNFIGYQGSIVIFSINIKKEDEI